MAHHLSKKLIVTLLVAGVLLVSGCSKTELGQIPEPARLDPMLVKSTVEDLIHYMLVQDERSTSLLAQLNIELSGFLAAPSKETRLRAQQAWQHAHEAYLSYQMTFFDSPNVRSRLIFALDAWPIQPGFLDSLPGYPDSGIINDVTIDVTSDILRQQHGITDDEEVCLGFHTIEYLIFQRSVTDFITDDSQDTVNELKKRRREMLRVVGQELVGDLSEMSRVLRQQIDPSAANDPSEQLLSLLRAARIHLRSVVEKSDFFSTQDYGHNIFSQTGNISLGVELTTLQQLTLEKVNCLPIFEVLNKTAAGNYEITLREAVRQVTSSDGTGPGQLPLMLSALLNQLEDFETALNQRMDPGGNDPGL